MMKFGIVGLSALAVVATAVSLEAQGPGRGARPSGQGGIGLYSKQAPAPTGPAPLLADGTPDLSGVWLGNGANSTDITRDLKPGDSVVMLPWAEEVVKHRQSKDDPEANCLPTGIPRGSPYPWRIAQTPGIYFIVYEGNIHSWRQIFMDGRKHPDDPDPTWYGNSIGHWEGKTLVVDTVGFNDKFWFDYKGHPHTEKLHTIERYTRTDMGHMTIETTIDDPGTYQKPFTAVGKAALMTGQDLMEYICQENNQDLQRLSGPARGPGNE